jgi:hypothetical protein
MMQSILSRSVRPVKLVLVALLAVGAAGCGGSGGGGSDTTVGAVPQDPTSVAPSVFASVGSFISFLNGLTQSDSSEPLAIDTSAPPVSDSDEPSNLS